MSEDFPVHLAGLRPGSLVAGYRLEAQIGAGGMAVVFRASDERLGRQVALKILAPALAADAAFRRRFIAESRAAAAVDDPHIIPVYEAGEADGLLFIAMRFVKGGDLRLVLEREGPLPPGRAAAFISPVASALDASHGAGLVHRDVKPANILVDVRPDRPDHVYLSDFGVSKGAISSVSLTGAGHFLGTPDYSAPEQIQGLAVDGRTDQYALACVAYQLLTGAVPFERDQGMAVLLAHLSQPPPSLSDRGPGLPGAADQVLAKGLAKVPEKRYQSCRDFADALREALGLAPYHPRDSASAPHHPQAGTASRPDFPRSAVTGNAAVPASPATIDFVPASAEMPAAAIAADRARTDATVPPSAYLAEKDRPAPDADGPADTANVLAAGPARAIRSEPGSHRSQPRRLPIIPTALVALLAIVVSGCFVGWRWSQDQYYVADSKGRVVIYRGISQRVLGISLSRVYQLTTIPFAQVPSSYQQTVKAAIAASSLGDAHKIVVNIQDAVKVCKQQYAALQAWASAENQYQAELVVAMKLHKPTKNILPPGPQPVRAGAMCPPSEAFGIPASALVPAATGHT